MTTEPDGVVNEVEQLLQRGGQAAADLARQRALARTRELRDNAREAQRAADHAQARLEAERQLASAQLANVDREDWWEHATAGEIVETWETAQRWREHDPVADRAATNVRAQMIDRLGVDPTRTGQEPFKAASPGDIGYHASRDVTPDMVRSWEAEVDQPQPIGARGRELQQALRELVETRRLANAARQTPVAETVAQGGPRRPPRAPKTRGLPGRGAERERGR